MRIGELSRRTGLSPSAIRYYEGERLIPTAERVSGRRTFDEGVLAQLVVVRLARDAGFTIAEIRGLVTEFGQNRWRRMAERKLGEIRATAKRLEMMTILLTKLLDCECPDIEFCGRVLRRMRATPEGRTGGDEPRPYDRSRLRR
jgi:MerR family transcriptional regulator, redox-sensitive transcriptional activator SoxR